MNCCLAETVGQLFGVVGEMHQGFVGVDVNGNDDIQEVI